MVLAELSLRECGYSEGGASINVGDNQSVRVLSVMVKLQLYNTYTK